MEKHISEEATLLFQVMTPEICSGCSAKIASVYQMLLPTSGVLLCLMGTHGNHDYPKTMLDMLRSVVHYHPWFLSWETLKDLTNQNS